MTKLNQWPTKKRIWVAFVFSILILLISTVIGWFWYRVGRAIGLFQPQSMHTIITEELLQDEEFIRVAQTYAEMYECNNTALQFSVYIPNQFITIESEESEKEKCTQFISKSNPKSQVPSLTIAPISATKSQAIDQQILAYEQVTVAPLSDQQVDIAKITAKKLGFPVQSYVLTDRKDTSTWVIEYYPASELYVDAVEKMAQSFTKLD